MNNARWLSAYEEFSKLVTAVELPDISTLDIHALDDAPLSELSATIEAIEIPDISDLSMSEAQEGSLKGLGIKVDAVAIPDTSHLEIEKTPEKGQANEKPQGKATFQIN
ncbi:hypothetical protein [sulfur-oxidizing endosymbiont of Gigantopelta aegis]|uniref:hypothetical protein n=1 Tax=sulfur-oxidizing endosymbiont of Gigantopelta aegis TaxID=2794934 RepID=UPI0018DBC6D2|nr:hypothetical protein [sulfur-oxidizing endosymbiont of Gigantopelta aegis]